MEAVEGSVPAKLQKLTFHQNRCKNGQNRRKSGQNRCKNGLNRRKSGQKQTNPVKKRHVSRFHVSRFAFCSTYSAFRFSFLRRFRTCNQIKSRIEFNQ